MGLGFSVASLAGRVRGGVLRMGLTRVAEEEWLQPDPDCAARAAAFDAHPESVKILPEAEAAGCEVARMVGVAGGLAEAGRAIWEDLCILVADDPAGPYRLAGGALAFPTDWHLAEKLGLPLTAVHAPIHGYAEQLATGVDRFLADLAPGPIFGRSNWFIVASDAWRYLPAADPATRFAHVTADNAGDTLFLRCERQTLRRLPETGAILFTIGVYVAPLRTLDSGIVGRVAAAVTATAAGEHERRAAPFYADALARYAAGREDADLEAAA